MSFKDVKELRTQGKLNEALKLALVELAIDSENIWNKRALAWVYYDFLKINSEYSKLNDFNLYWDKLMGIDLSEDNNQILHESIGLQLGKVVFSVFRESELPTNVLDELFEKAKLLSIERPSKANSFLIKAFLKGSKTWPNIHLVPDYFGFEGFSDSDYYSEEFNGKAITSTVEKFYNLTCKFLLDASKKLPANHPNLVAQINEFLPILSRQIVRNPEYQYLPYFRAKLLLSIGENQDVFTAFLPFAKRKKTEFWVWEVIADTFEESDENRFACFCKALSLKSPEEFLIGLRMDFAKILIQKEMFTEAKLEISKVVEIRTSKGWKISNEIQQIMNQKWFLDAPILTSNQDLYKRYIDQAESLLFGDVQEHIITVEFVNRDKQMITFVKNRNHHGFFSYKSYLQKPAIGEVYKARFSEASNDGFHKLLSISKANENEHPEALKKFEGDLKVNEKGNFGFIDDVFFDPTTIQKLNLKNLQKVTGTAILSFNKKKEQWGWKVLNIS